MAAVQKIELDFLNFGLPHSYPQVVSALFQISSILCTSQIIKLTGVSLNHLTNLFWEIIYVSFQIFFFFLNLVMPQTIFILFFPLGEKFNLSSSGALMFICSWSLPKKSKKRSAVGLWLLSDASAKWYVYILFACVCVCVCVRVCVSVCECVCFTRFKVLTILPRRIGKKNPVN